MIKKAKKNGLLVRQSSDIPAFMKILTESLYERHKSKPVHTLAEIQYLSDKFPNNIKLFSSYKSETMLAGFMVYESDNVAHGQYAGNSREGRNIGAQDIIEDYLINEYYKDKKYFDFGTSNSDFGRKLNLGLISRKESFGASAVMYDLYQLHL
jgi:lipid II:glycine glycyltransferase (peptidoglycan interpeptide bridge formation enzyme)